jgi:hypothetical protein
MDSGIVCGVVPLLNFLDFVSVWTWVGGFCNTEVDFVPTGRLLLHFASNIFNFGEISKITTILDDSREQGCLKNHIQFEL